VIPYSFPYFGPFIFKAQINNQQVEEIKKLCIKDKTKDHSRKLAGHIKEEYEIDSNRYHQVMTPYLDTYCEGYEKFYDKKFKGTGLTTKQVWVNFMKAGEYNPPHHHGGCRFSSVVFLDVPPQIKKEADAFHGTSHPPGSIEFVVHIGDVQEYIACYRHFPQKGDALIFPANVTHTVYPFQCKATRVSVAANYLTI